MYGQDAPGAAREAIEAARLLPSAPHPPYIQGLLARTENRAADALRDFERVRQLDPTDVGTNVNLGQIYLEQRCGCSPLPTRATSRSVPTKG